MIENNHVQPDLLALSIRLGDCLANFCSAYGADDDERCALDDLVEACQSHGAPIPAIIREYSQVIDSPKESSANPPINVIVYAEGLLTFDFDPTLTLKEIILRQTPVIRDVFGWDSVLMTVIGYDVVDSKPSTLGDKFKARVGISLDLIRSSQGARRSSAQPVLLSDPWRIEKVCQL